MYADVLYSISSISSLRNALKPRTGKMMELLHKTPAATAAVIMSGKFTLPFDLVSECCMWEKRTQVSSFCGVLNTAYFLWPGVLIYFHGSVALSTRSQNPRSSQAQAPSVWKSRPNQRETRIRHNNYMKLSTLNSVFIQLNMLCIIIY